MKDNDILFTPEHMQRIYGALSQNHELRQGLVQLAMEQGKSFKTGQILTDEVICQVSRFENTRLALSDDAQQVADRLFRQMENMDDETRYAKKRELNFGLGIAQDWLMMEKIEDEGCDFGQLFERCCTSSRYSPEREKQLERAIRAKLETYHLSGRAMKKLEKSLLESGNWVCTAGALSVKGHELKCMAAMELYLSQPELSIEDAAVAACTGVQMQAVADAVDRGMMTEKTARDIITAVMLTAAVVSFGVTVYVIAETGKYLLPFAAFSLVSLVAKKISKKAAPVLGQWAVKAPILWAEEMESAQNGWAKLTAWAKEKAHSAEDDWLDDCGYDDEDEQDCFPDYLIY